MKVSFWVQFDGDRNKIIKKFERDNKIQIDGCGTSLNSDHHRSDFSFECSLYKIPGLIKYCFEKIPRCYVTIHSIE